MIRRRRGHRGEAFFCLILWVTQKTSRNLRKHGTLEVGLNCFHRPLQNDTYLNFPARQADGSDVVQWVSDVNNQSRQGLLLNRPFFLATVDTCFLNLGESFKLRLLQQEKKKKKFCPWIISSTYLCDVWPRLSQSSFCPLFYFIFFAKLSPIKSKGICIFIADKQTTCLFPLPTYAKLKCLSIFGISADE